MRRILSNLPALTALLVLIVFCVVTGIRHHGFLEPGVFWNILRDNAFLGVVAAGETLVILSGGIDLSVGAVVGLTTVCVAKLIERGMHPLLAIALCLLGGLAFGAAQGKIISAFKSPPFLVTLAGMFLARGVAYLISTDAAVISNPFYDKLSGLQWLAPAIFGIIILLGQFALSYRPFGRNIYALGGNENSAALMGVHLGRTKVALYALCGFCAALGGVAYSFYTVSGDPTAGVTLELDAITAVVIGGTLLTGGYGSLLGTVVGVLMLGAIQSSLTYEENISSWWSRIIVGALLLLFLLVQKALEKGVLRMLASRARAG